MTYIVNILKSYQNVLPHFDVIMRSCIQGKEFKEFI